MFIPLKHVPPLLSHMFCLFTGLILAYYFSADKTGPECFVPGKLLVAFPEHYLAEGVSPIAPGRKVYFAKKAPYKECLIENSISVIVQNDPFVVAAFNLKSAQLLSQILHSKNKGHLKLVSEMEMTRLQPCVENVIQYGYAP